MKILELLPSSGVYYKANLHCHTVHSDGTLTPEEIKKLYQENGYSVVAYTDHRKYSGFHHLTDDKFLAISAMEADINEFGNKERDFSEIKTYHINFYDMEPENHVKEKMEICQPQRRYFDTEYINQYVDNMRDLGFIACYNHPYWSLQSSEDYKNLRGFWAMEIYNHGCEHDGLYGYHPQAYDEMLRAGQRLFCVAADDNHNSYPPGHPFFDSFGGFTMICAKELSYTAIMDALFQGNFYSSMGPEFKRVTLEENKLKIRCSPVSRIYVKTKGRYCYKAAAMPGEFLTEAEFIITGKEGYIRVDIMDEKGLHANTNAWFLDDITNWKWKDKRNV